MNRRRLLLVVVIVLSAGTAIMLLQRKSITRLKSPPPVVVETVGTDVPFWEKQFLERLREVSRTGSQIRIVSDGTFRAPGGSDGVLLLNLCDPFDGPPDHHPHSTFTVEAIQRPRGDGGLAVEVRPPFVREEPCLGRSWHGAASVADFLCRARVEPALNSSSPP